VLDGESIPIIDKDNRESIAYYVRNLFIQTRDGNASEGWLNDLNDIYNHNIFENKSLDMFADDPVFRQLKLDME
jgi:hypothetical protein